MFCRVLTSSVWVYRLFCLSWFASGIPAVPPAASVDIGSLSAGLIDPEAIHQVRVVQKSTAPSLWLHQTAAGAAHSKKMHYPGAGC